MALDLSVPPVALLVLQLLVLWVASAMLAVTGQSQLPLAISTLGVAMLLSSVLICWFRCGRGIISIGSLALAGFYAVGKIPVYLRFLVARQTRWLRSSRDDDGTD